MTRIRILAVIAVAAVVAGFVGAAAAVLVGRNSSAAGRTTTTVIRAVAATPAARTSGSSVIDAYRAANAGVVEITVTTSSGGFGGGTAQAQGSGFVYDTAGHVITNEHVVDGATSVSVRLGNGARYKATVVGSDASTDLAVVKISAPASALHALTLADSSSVVVGQPVVAIGSPFGLENTVTSGIVSALHREIDSPNNFTIEDAIQTDAAINHGNSGGPLLDLSGRVVGVNAQIKSDSGGNEGVGFAIPSNTVRTIARTIITKGSVQHAYLGVSLAGSGSARVDQVRPGTPAASAGLQSGDVVTTVDGRPISTGAELRAAIDAKRPGDVLRLRVTRNGSERTVTVTLGNRPA